MSITFGNCLLLAGKVRSTNKKPPQVIARGEIESEAQLRKRQHKPSKSYLRNCLIIPRHLGAGKPAMFTVTPEGLVTVQLDGYAIVPRKDYERLLKSKKAK